MVFEFSTKIIISKVFIFSKLLCSRQVSINWYQSSFLLGLLYHIYARRNGGQIGNSWTWIWRVVSHAGKYAENPQRWSQGKSWSKSTSSRINRPDTSHTANNTGSPNDNDDDASIHTKHPRKHEEWWRKLEIPIFEGTSAYGWLNRVEHYVDLKRMSDNEKLQVVMVAMEGKALSWYQWWEFSSQNPTWEDFRTAIPRRSQPSMIQSPFKLLLSLKQTGTVEEYREQFEMYDGSLKCTETSYLKGIFLNGLKDIIRT